MNLPEIGGYRPGGEAMDVQSGTARGGRRRLRTRTAVLSRCLICGRETGDGLRIRGKTICRQCEAKLLNTRVGSPGYEQFLRRIRRLWPETPVDE